jgi:aryl-alcohol dehydrogenase-like predicted oxidoreductase
MKQVPLGRTGITVSALCYGTMSFGGDADEAEAARLYGACRDAGIDFFDCADVYNGGRAEEILGRLVAHERDRIVLTSKCGMKSAIGNGLSRRHILNSVEASLRRLATDRLDVLFLHRFDDDAPLEETLRTLEDLVRAGKVLYLGVSNFAAWQIATALGVQARHAWSRIDLVQPMYNLVKRQAEVELLPLARAEGLAVTPYGPNAGGLLTGKYRGNATPEGARLSARADYAKRYRLDWYHETAAAFTEFADARGIHPVSLAVAWTAHHPSVTCPIVGARSVEQLRASLDSVTVEMTDTLWAEIAALSRTPPPATDRLEETA